jgi:hypothetical protein
MQGGRCSFPLTEEQVMANHFFSSSIRAISAFFALIAAVLLVTSCNVTTADELGSNNKEEVLPPATGIPETDIAPIPPILPPGGELAVPIPPWDTIQLMVRTDPADPHNERFLDDWRFRVFTIDDQTRPTSPVYFGETGPDGNALLGLPSYMFALPLVINAYNDVLPLECGPIENDIEPNFVNHRDKHGTNCHCQDLEIFIPPYCHDKAVWLLGPLEDALWRFYKQSAMKRGEAWNPSQVDCGTWLANLQLLILTKEVSDELNELSDRDDMIFRDQSLHKALQENQHLLVPTRPPICMAERRHNGGGMRRGDQLTINGDYILDDFGGVFGPTEVLPDDDPIAIDSNTGLANFICSEGLWETGELRVNNFVFSSFKNYVLDDDDFIGTVSDHPDIDEKLDASIYNVRLSNGRELDHDKYDDACALTTMIEFTNKDDDELDLQQITTGVTFTDIFQAGEANVYLTSDGDAVVDDDDYWAIFYRPSDLEREEKVIAVELLGHRKEDFRDVLHMTFDDMTDNLFLGLRADYEMNEEEVDGERAFLGFTMHVWDGSTDLGKRAVRENIANCYEAADVWARQFFISKHFAFRKDDCHIDGDCKISKFIAPLKAAEFAVRSQCFSNSRANQRWRTDDSGYWSINTEHGVHGNIVVNPGWLAPNLDYEIYIQKFDEAVFKGPRTIRRTDDCGQLMAAIPTLVEGDRVLIKSEDNCCDDYDLVIPCVPEFTGFAGAPGIPYVPLTLGPPPIPPIGPGPVGPIAPPIGPGGPIPDVGGPGGGFPGAGPIAAEIP